jgi:hypothetical protein
MRLVSTTQLHVRKAANPSSGRDRTDTAWDEAAAMCSDMIRDIIKRLGDSPEWRLEVADKSGTVRHLFRLTAESFDP